MSSNEPTEKSKTSSSDTSINTPEFRQKVLRQFVEMVKQGQIQLAPGNSVNLTYQPPETKP